ncbi:MAG TPA: hypothetical protein VFB54_01930, partial [Burkholderiales bacterium]|nr:hypothetical protein [Burkholderiales bacterium]
MTDASVTTTLDSLLRGQSELPASPRTWLNALRADALERANALSVPSTRDEEWRYTDLSPLYKSSFQRLQRAPTLDTQAIEGLTLPEAHCRLTFVDGHFDASLSTGLSEGEITVQPLASAQVQKSGVVQTHLARYVA